MSFLAIYLPYGFGGVFDPLFNKLGEIRVDVYDTLTLFTYVLAFAGLLLCVYRQQTGGDLSSIGTQLMMTAVVAVVLNFLPDWILDAENVLGWSMLDSMNIDMESITVEWEAKVASFVAEEVGIIVAALAASEAFNVWNMIGGIVAIIYAMVAFVLIIVVALIGFLVWIALIAAYIVQGAAIEIGIATSPLFLGMFLFPTTKETAIRYFTGLFGVMLWPLGWGIGYAIVDLVSDGIFTVFWASGILLALDLLVAGIVSFVIYYVEAMLFWTVIKKAPQLITKAITTGTQIGAGLVSAGIASAASTVSNTISAAGSVASTSILMAGTAAGAAIGGVAGGPMGAAAGASVGGAIGGAAGGVASGGANAVGGGIKAAGQGLAEMGEGA